MQQRKSDRGSHSADDDFHCDHCQQKFFVDIRHQIFCPREKSCIAESRYAGKNPQFQRFEKIVMQVIKSPGKKKSETKNSTESNYNYLLFGLYDDREIVYERINKRVDKMIDDGLLNEVQNLINQGVTKENQCAQAIGYKEPYDYLLGNTTKEEFIEKLKQNTRNYAKRQITWLKKMPNIIWKKYSEKEEIFKLVGDFING